MAAICVITTMTFLLVFQEKLHSKEGIVAMFKKSFKNFYLFYCTE